MDMRRQLMGPKMVMLYCVLCWCVGQCVIRSIFNLEILKLSCDDLIGVKQWILYGLHLFCFISCYSLVLSVVLVNPEFQSHLILDLLDLSIYFERCYFISHISQQFVLKKLAGIRPIVFDTVLFFETVPRHVCISLRVTLSLTEDHLSVTLSLAGAGLL
jgi:hypothetical protein